MRALTLCMACKRHVKAHESVCPFCSAAMLGERNQAGRSPRGLPGGRAALFLSGAAALAAPGCVDEHDPDDDEMAVPVYGIAIDGGAPRQDAGRSVDAGLVAQPYGIAIPWDASIQTPRDAGPSCPQVGNLPVPVYGIGIDVPPDNACLDAGSDAGQDGGVDAGSDAGIDAGSDAGTDGGADAGRDAGKDSGLIAVPPYGIAIDSGIIAVPTYGIAIDPER